MKKLMLTEEGLNNLKREIEIKKEELRELGKYKGSAAANEGDAWHDNFAFEQTEIKERSLILEIKELENQLSSAEIISSDNSSDKNVVGINSEVTVIMKFDEDDEEEHTFTLVGNYCNAGLSNVSLNSPMGECINQKPVGFEGKYTVNGNEIYVKIIKINNK